MNVGLMTFFKNLQSKPKLLPKQYFLLSAFFMFIIKASDQRFSQILFLWSKQIQSLDMCICMYVPVYAKRKKILAIIFWVTAFWSLMNCYSNYTWNLLHKALSHTCICIFSFNPDSKSSTWILYHHFYKKVNELNILSKNTNYYELESEVESKLTTFLLVTNKILCI